jgi:uncharacterized membrane protein required for colicin V production
MVFWTGILAGGLFAWFAIRIGFYEMWAMLFNIVISIYVAVFLTPVIIDIIPAAGDTSYGNALTMATAAIGVFLILYVITYLFLTGQFKVSFPRIFETLGAGVLGFLAGFLIWSFAAVLIWATPVSQHTFVKNAGFGGRIRQTSVPYISWWCNLVHSIGSSPENEITSEQIINQMLKTAELNVLDKISEEVEPDKPIESDDADTDIRIKNRPAPPPDSNSEDI